MPIPVILLIKYLTATSPKTKSSQWIPGLRTSPGRMKRQWGSPRWALLSKRARSPKPATSIRRRSIRAKRESPGISGKETNGYRLSKSSVMQTNAWSKNTCSMWKEMPKKYKYSTTRKGPLWWSSTWKRIESKCTTCGISSKAIKNSGKIESSSLKSTTLFFRRLMTITMILDTLQLNWRIERESGSWQITSPSVIQRHGEKAILFTTNVFQQIPISSYSILAWTQLILGTTRFRTWVRTISRIMSYTRSSPGGKLRISQRTQKRTMISSGKKKLTATKRPEPRELRTGKKPL